MGDELAESMKAIPESVWPLVLSNCNVAELSCVSVTSKELSSTATRTFFEESVSVFAVKQTLKYKPGEKRVQRLMDANGRDSRLQVDAEIVLLQVCFFQVRKEQPGNAVSMSSAVELFMRARFGDCRVAHCVSFLNRSKEFLKAGMLQVFADLDIDAMLGGFRELWARKLYSRVCVRTVVQTLLELVLRTPRKPPIDTDLEAFIENSLRDFEGPDQ